MSDIDPRSVGAAVEQRAGFLEPLILKAGKTLASYELVYETYGKIDAEHQRLVRNLEAALRDERGERRLARARDADEDDVRLLEVARLAPLVALPGELDRLDASEIFVGEREHRARQVDGRLLEQAPDLRDERADEVH